MDRLVPHFTGSATVLLWIGLLMQAVVYRKRSRSGWAVTLAVAAMALSITVFFQPVTRCIAHAVGSVTPPLEFMNIWGVVPGVSVYCGDPKLLISSVISSSVLPRSLRSKT